MWVSTTVEAVPDNVDEQLGLAFDRLFNYISGENDRGKSENFHINYILKHNLNLFVFLKLSALEL